MEGSALSAGSLFASLFVSTIGLGLFLYGKKATRFLQLFTGMALMGFPYFVHGTAAVLGIAAGLLALMGVLLRVSD